MQIVLSRLYLHDVITPNELNSRSHHGRIEAATRRSTTVRRPIHCAQQSHAREPSAHAQRQHQHGQHHFELLYHAWPTSRTLETEEILRRCRQSMYGGERLPLSESSALCRTPQRLVDSSLSLPRQLRHLALGNLAGEGFRRQHGAELP